MIITDDPVLHADKTGTIRSPLDLIQVLHKQEMTSFGVDLSGC